MLGEKVQAASSLWIDNVLKQDIVMMKKPYLWVAVTAFLLAACQKDEWQITVPDATNDLIRFGIPTIRVEADTRSTTYNALPVGGQFGVLGYCVPYTVSHDVLDYGAGASLWGTKFRLCPPSVFYKQAVTVTDGNYCSYASDVSGLKHWYTDGHGLDGEELSEVTDADNYRYTFFAYYPFDGAFTVDAPASAEEGGAPKFTFTMPQSGTDLNVELDHTITPDAMFAQPAYNHRRTQGSVDFTFSHLLTALGFEVNNFSEYNLTIHSITLSGCFFKEIVLDFSQTGTLSAGAYSFPASYYTGKYTILNDALVLNPVEGQESVSSGLLPRNANGEGEHILLISGAPPYFGPDGSGDNQVKVNIDYTFGDGISPEQRQVSYARPETFAPTPGTKYTAQLNFVGNAFVLQFVVDNNEMWENGGSDDDFKDPDSGEDVGGDVVFE